MEMRKLTERTFDDICCMLAQSRDPAHWWSCLRRRHQGSLEERVSVWVEVSASYDNGGCDC
jgi:hypothetical protein